MKLKLELFFKSLHDTIFNSNSRPIIKLMNNTMQYNMQFPVFISTLDELHKYWLDLIFNFFLQTVHIVCRPTISNYLSRS